MTKTKHDKTDKPAAVELNDASLDRAVGGGFTKSSGIKWEVEVAESTPGTNVLTSNDTSGRGG